LLGPEPANTISIVNARLPQLLGLLLLAAACEPVPEGTEPVATTTHALLRVERSDLLDAGEQATGTAFAGVVRFPETADPEPLLRLSGKALRLPAAGQCQTASRERELDAPAEAAHAEFLEAGDVLLSASEGRTQLAPHNFPSTQADLSGVVYSSRDRASDPLPGGAPYLLRTTGSDQLPALEVQVQAPDLLSEVTIDGTALAPGSTVASTSDVTVSWRRGDARDLVYVEVVDAELGRLGVCAFRDSEGRGTLPRGVFGASGAGSLALHRLREVAADVRGIDAAEVRFDFELTAEVSFR
jgi:hypothetical protein